MDALVEIAANGVEFLATELGVLVGGLHRVEAVASAQ